MRPQTPRKFEQKGGKRDKPGSQIKRGKRGDLLLVAGRAGRRSKPLPVGGGGKRQPEKNSAETAEKESGCEKEGEGREGGRGSIRWRTNGIVKSDYRWQRYSSLTHLPIRTSKIRLE